VYPLCADVREAFTKEVAKEKKAEAMLAELKGQADLAAAAKVHRRRGAPGTRLVPGVANASALPGGYNDPIAAIGAFFGLDSAQATVGERRHGRVHRPPLHGITRRRRPWKPPAQQDLKGTHGPGA
jgi:hypothetical protein